MKKSKLLAPAFAFLALSTAAAVTGTVAWFTASRVVTINASAITAYNPEENLTVTLSDAKGASITRATDNESAVGSGHDAEITIGHLRDASVDLANQKVYRAILDEEGDELEAYEEVTADATTGEYKAGQYNSVNLFYAAKYTATFSLANDADLASNKTYDLLFDNARTTASGDSDIKEGLRIGICISATNFVVIAPFKAGTDKTSETLNYVTGETLSDTDTYAGSKCAYLKDSTNTGQTFDIGDLNASDSSKDEVVATVFTWFEGEDADVINANVDNVALSVQLSFRIAEQA